MSASKPDTDGIAVIGLGRFGSRLAESLSALGHEVLAIDRDSRRVQKWSALLDQVAQADSTDDQALRQLGVADLNRVVVAIGASLESSVLTVLALVELGVPQIWARATSTQHSKILSAVGAQHVIFPEKETGERLAHLIASRMLDFMEFGDAFAIAKMHVPAPVTGHHVTEQQLLDRYGIRIIGVKRPAEQRYHYVSDSLLLRPDDIVIVEGTIEQVQAFASLS